MRVAVAVVTEIPPPLQEELAELAEEDVVETTPTGP
jgi:hypothetical protein